MQFRNNDPNRAEIIKHGIEEFLPKSSQVDVADSVPAGELEIGQVISISVLIHNLNSPLHWIFLQGRLYPEISQLRSINWRVKELHGPPSFVLLISAHLALIPWLIFRYQCLPRQSPPVRPILQHQFVRDRTVPLSLFAGLLAGVLISLFFLMAISSGFLTFSDQMPSLDSLGATTAISIFSVALAVSLAGFVEEALFRGLLLRPFFKNAVALLGIAVCAGWFTAVHMTVGLTHSGNIVYLVSVLFAGLIFGWMTLRYQSWVPAGMAHAGYNFSVTLTFAALG